MNKTYKAHPIMIFDLVKPFIFILVLPLVTALLHFFTDKNLTNLLAVEILCFLAIVGIGVARFFAFKLILTDDILTIKSGFLFRRTSSIKLSRISSVQIERNPFDMIFCSVTCKINTEAGTLKRSDFKFKLKHKDSTELSELLFLDKTISRVRFSAFKVAIMAAATSSAATGMIVGVPLLHRMGKLLGIGIEEMLLDRINDVSNKFQNYFPPIVNTVTLVVLLAYAFSFAYSFLKHINFKLSFGEERLIVRSGFFVRTKTAFMRSRVNNAKIEQTLLMRLIRRYSLKVSVGGFDDSKSVSQVVVPSGRRRAILNDFSEYFPFLESKGRPICPDKRMGVKNRFFMWPTVYLILTLAVSIFCCLRFPEFDRLIQFLTLVLLSIIFFYAFSCLYEYRYGTLKLGDNIFAQSSRFFGTRTMCCPKTNIGQVKITQFPLDRYQKICRVRLTVCSENADSIRVKFIEHSQAVKELTDCFNLGGYFNLDE